MNHLVATLAPKTKDHFKTNSLRTRVMLCASAEVVGHHDLWIRVFNKFNLELDANLNLGYDTQKKNFQLMYWN